MTDKSTTWTCHDCGEDITTQKCTSDVRGGQVVYFCLDCAPPQTIPESYARRNRFLLTIAAEDWNLKEAVKILREVVLENDALRARLAVLDIDVPFELSGTTNVTEGEKARSQREAEKLRGDDPEYGEAW